MVLYNIRGCHAGGLILRIEDSASKRIMYLCDSYGLDKNEVYEKA